LLVIGLTGGIGSGKSTVTEFLIDKGYDVIDADVIAREIVAPGTPTLQRLVSVFSDEILNEDKSLNRKKLGSIVFGDSMLCQQLNDIMHGEIFRIIEERVEEMRVLGYNKTVFLDLPLLFETATAELYELMDQIWVVDTDDEIRIRRIMARDGTSRDSVLQIMSNQMSSEEKRKKADVVILNSGSKEDLYSALENLLVNIK
jgi:dephospho-CoA kinase